MMSVLRLVDAGQASRADKMLTHLPDKRETRNEPPDESSDNLQSAYICAR
jgi:hypothetical protein